MIIVLEFEIADFFFNLKLKCICIYGVFQSHVYLWCFDSKIRCDVM